MRLTRRQFRGSLPASGGFTAGPAARPLVYRQGSIVIAAQFRPPFDGDRERRKGRPMEAR